MAKQSGIQESHEFQGTITIVKTKFLASHNLLGSFTDKKKKHNARIFMGKTYLFSMEFHPQELQKQPEDNLKNVNKYIPSNNCFKCK